MHVEMFIKPLFSMYINGPFPVSKAYIDNLREMLKVILAVISLPGYANHNKYRITFFSIIKRHIRNPNTSENLHRVESDGYTAARSTSVTFHKRTHQTVFIF